MKNQFLEAGQIVNTHGIQGEVKIVPWCDSPEFLLQFGTLYLDGNARKGARRPGTQGQCPRRAGGRRRRECRHGLKGKIVSIDRSGVVLPEGRHFIADPLGLRSWTPAAGRSWGLWPTCSPPPAHEVYVVKGEHEYMIPAVDEFLAETNVEGGYIKVRLIEGMRTDV